MHDGWTDIFRNLTGTAAKEAARKLGRRLNSEERAELMELADYKKMNQVRARVDAIVKDPVTAAALKPWYRQFCKRPCFHDEYLPTYNRPNVTLVDTNGHGVERLTERGVVANGKRIRTRLSDLRDRIRSRHVVHAPRRLRHRRPRRQNAVGTLVRRSAHAARPHDARLPELFLPRLHADRDHDQRAAGVERTSQTRDAHGDADARAGPSGAGADRPKANSLMSQEVRSLARIGERFYRECTPGYYNSEGAAGNKNGFFSEMYGAGPLRFFEVLEEWRANGRMEGLELR